MEQDKPTVGDTTTYVICVTVLVSKIPKRTYQTFYSGVPGKKRAEEMMELIRRKGCKHEGRRYFPDEIESLTMKVHEK